MMNDIKRQYKTPNNLNTRISIHEKYSTNQQSFGDWITSHYEIGSNYRILELGCGTGDIWKNNLHLLSYGTRLVLTDISEGMLEAARANICGHPQVDYRVADIQDLPFGDESFDMVIANMMLYHVPKLDKGLSEVRRVLKTGGAFYAATYGEHGIMEFINEALSALHISGSIGKQFTLQNGGEVLGRHFDHVEKLTREDGLRITKTEDFADYILSLSSLTGLEGVTKEVILPELEQKSVDGILYVPKEYGMFICK